MIIGSRPSDLASWQTNFVKWVIERNHPHIEVVIKPVSTKGNKILDVALSKIGEKGLFTKELELELLHGNWELKEDISGQASERLVFTCLQTLAG